MTLVVIVITSDKVLTLGTMCLTVWGCPNGHSELTINADTPVIVVLNCVNYDFFLFNFSKLIIVCKIFQK